MATLDAALVEQQREHQPNQSMDHNDQVTMASAIISTNGPSHLVTNSCNTCSLSFHSKALLDEHINKDHLCHGTVDHGPHGSHAEPSHSQQSHPSIFNAPIENTILLATHTMDKGTTSVNGEPNNQMSDCNQPMLNANFHNVTHPHQPQSHQQYDAPVASSSTSQPKVDSREFKYKCRACQPNRLYFDRLKLERHVERKHNFEIECDFCIAVFQDEKSMRDHLEAKHGIKLTEDDLKDDSANHSTENESDVEGSDYILPENLIKSSRARGDSSTLDEEESDPEQVETSKAHGGVDEDAYAPVTTNTARSVRKASRKCLSRIRKLNETGGVGMNDDDDDLFSDLELDQSASDSDGHPTKTKKRAKNVEETPEEKARRQKKRLPEGASRRYKGRPGPSAANNSKKKADARCKYQEFKNSVVWSGSRSRNGTKVNKEGKDSGDSNEPDGSKKKRGRPKKPKDGAGDGQDEPEGANVDPDAPEWEKHLQKIKKKIPGVSDTCRKCGKEFSDDNVLVRHLKFDHYFKEVLNLTDENPMKREQQWRNQINELLSRSNSGSNSGSGKWGSRDLTCDICKVRFGYPCTLATHRKEKHNAETIINGQVIDPGPLPTETESLVCDECGFTTKNRASFESHYIAIHKKDKNPYPCDQCDESFLRACGLLWHRRQQHMKTPIFVCDMCGRGYRLKYLFLRHQRLDHGGHRYQCKLCPKSFKGRASYDYHRRKHMGVQGMKFICEFCGMRFWANQNRRKHIEKCHADGVIDHAALAMNQSKDWSAEASGAARCVSSNNNRNKSVNNRTSVPAATSTTIATLIATPVETVSQYSDQSVDETGYQVQHVDAATLAQQQQQTQQLHPTQATIIAHPQHQQLQQIQGAHLFQTTDQSTTVATHTIFQAPSTTGHNSCQFATMQPVSVSMFTYPNIPQQVLHQTQPTHISIPGKCKLCFANVEDLRDHMVSFHKVAGEALKFFLQ